MSARRAEIEAKRARLAELRRAREERARRAAEPRTDVRARLTQPLPAAAPKEDLDALVASLIHDPKGDAPDAQRGAPDAHTQTSTTEAAATTHAESPARAESPTSGAGPTSGAQAPHDGPRGAPAHEPRTPAPAHELHTPAPAHELRTPAPPAPAAPPTRPPRILYSKQVQTDTEPTRAATPPTPPTPARPATPHNAPSSPPAPAPREELGAEYADFVHAKSAVMERVLDETYDVLTDYTRVADDAQAPRTEALRHVHTFMDAALEGRAVTDADWSTCVRGLADPSTPSCSPSATTGAVCRRPTRTASWPCGTRTCGSAPSLRSRLRCVALYVLTQTDVTAVRASPFHPTLYVGGTYSGQLLLWDARQRGLPVQRTPLSFSAGAGSGHCAPVYSLRIVGTAQAPQVVSASLDGLVCTWTMDMLARPQESIMLANPLHPRSAEVGVASLDVPAGDATRFLLGTEEGNVYGASRYDRAGAAAGLDTEFVYVGHAAPVTRLECHPNPRGRRAPVDFSDLFLTSSMDWSSALWRAADRAAPRAPRTGYHYPHANPRIATSTRTNPLAFRGGAGSHAPWTAVAPLCRFENQLDYVMDVRWHPQHPALFAQVDVAGRLELYNLNHSCERTLLSATAPGARGLNRVAWERGEPATKLAAGAMDGRVHLYEVPEAVATPREAEWAEMQEVLAALAPAQAPVSA